MNLFGKVAIVTGAARGLGRAYAQKLFEMGCNVVAADIEDVQETIDSLYGAGKSLGCRLDVADPESVQAMVDATVDRFGRIDILVNNAALYGSLTGGRLETLDSDEWDACMKVNVKGIWHTVKAVTPVMRKYGGGSIINISSLAAVYGLPYALHYSASKGAVIAMTRAMARELGRDWIRVNAIAPTAVNTEGTEAFFGEKLEQSMDTIRKGQALKRNLDPEDLVGTVLYLASDASKFVTGQTIMVDGGTQFL